MEVFFVFLPKICNIKYSVYLIFKGDLRPKLQLCLKWFSFIIKQNAIDRKFQKFTCQPLLTCFASSFVCMAWLMLRYSLITENLISSWKMVKNTLRLYRKLFLHKTSIKMQRKPMEYVLYIRKYDATYAEFKTL